MVGQGRYDCGCEVPYERSGAMDAIASLKVLAIDAWYRPLPDLAVMPVLQLR